MDRAVVDFKFDKEAFLLEYSRIILLEAPVLSCSLKFVFLKASDTE